MTPTLSEFSYGFALTNEMIGLAGEPLRIAPVFPNLVEEGRAGGGYDVHLGVPGFPLFIQFKRSDALTRSNTRERAMGLPLVPTYFRFPITGRTRSAQHDMLCDLDAGANQVFYAAPRFYKVDELDAAYLAGKVAERSFYIRPRDIGKFADDDGHHVVFDHAHHYVCSEARRVSAYRGAELVQQLRERLTADERPLRAGPLKEALAFTEEVVRRRGIDRGAVRPEVDEAGDERGDLRQLADLSLRFFGTQLFIVQPRTTAQRP